MRSPPVQALRHFRFLTKREGHREAALASFVWLSSSRWSLCGDPEFDSPECGSQQSKAHEDLDRADYVFGQGRLAMAVRVRGDTSFGFGCAGSALLGRHSFINAHVAISCLNFSFRGS